MKKRLPVLLNIRLNIFIVMYLVISVLAVYLQIRNHGFIIYDDTVYVTDNPYIREGINTDTLKWAFSLNENKTMYWHPLTWLSHMFDVWIYGLHSGQHHITNLIFHIFNSILLFYIFQRMSGRIWESAAVAILFALHPLNVESVAWVASRKNVLSTFFWMATILFYIKYTERRGIRDYFLCLAAFSLGLMAKQMVITLPFILILLDYWPLNRVAIPGMNGWDNRDTRGLLSPVVLEKLPFILLALIATYIAAVSMQQTNIIISYESVSLLLRLKNAIVSYVSYLWKTIWPIHLGIFYPFPKSIQLWKTGVALLFLLSMSIISVYFVRKKPYFFVGWFWFLGALIPVSGIVQAGLWPAMADRWAYVPVIGIFVIITWLAPDLFVRRKHHWVIVTLSCLAVISFVMFKAWQQTRYWESGYGIFKHTVDITTNNSVAHNNLGSIYAMNGMIQPAKKHFLKAYTIDPENESAGNNLARSLVLSGRIDEGIAQYRAVLKYHPNNIRAMKNIALAYIAKKEYEKALEYFKEWKKIEPKNPESYYYIAKLYDVMGKNDESFRWVKKAMQKGMNRELIKNDKNLNKYLN